MREGPLGAYVDAFAQHLSDDGYAKASSRYALQLVADLGRWLHRRKITAQHITSEHLGHYLQYRHRCGRHRSGDAAIVRRLFNLLLDNGVVAQSLPIEPTPAERLEEQFRLYLERERRLAPATVFHYLAVRPALSRALPRRWRATAGCFACGRCGGLCPARGGSAASPQTRQVDDHGPAFVPAVRALHRPDQYRFAIECSDGGELVDGLASAGTVRGGRPTPSCPLRSAHGGRASQLGDHASACPLGVACRGSGRLGARGSRLGSGRAAGSGIRGHWDRLPMPQDVGAALVDYLRHARPHCSSRRVFVRTRAPHRGFASSVAISCIVRRALERAGLDPPHKGAHLLRHSVATQMLRQGASLAEIGELLRHRSPQTTMIYAKVDLDLLRPLALPWPGGAR